MDQQFKHGVFAYRSLKDLHKHPSNPRFIDDDDFKTLVASIKKNPDYFEARPLILSDRTGELVIIAGNQRFDAATYLKKKEVPTYLLSGLTEEREKEIAIRDNINNGQWDWDILHSDDWNSQPLEEWGLPPAFDPEVKVKDDDFEMPDEVETDIVRGDLIEIGNHRLLCGDATKMEDVKLMDGKKADMVFTDPPYNVNYGSVKNHPSWKRTKKGEEKINPEAITNDNLSIEDWSVFVRAYLQSILKTCQGAIYICMSNKEMYSNQNIFIELGGIWSTFIIWKKDRFVMGMSDYQRQYEPILYGWKNGVTKFWCGDRKQSDIWEVARPQSSPEHPTMKPIELCGRAINNSSGNNNIVQDLFLGSGSTMVAAHQINRVCYGLEIEPKYCQVIIDRMLRLDPTLKIKKNGQSIN